MLPGWDTTTGAVIGLTVVPSVATTGAAGGVIGLVETAGIDGLAELELAKLVFESEPPPPPHATRVVPNAAIAAIRIAKFWWESVMAIFKEVTLGNIYCPMEFL